jgi:hypothetical protein
MREALQDVRVVTTVRVVPHFAETGGVDTGTILASGTRSGVGRCAGRFLVLAACGLACCGCSSGAYEREYAARLEAYTTGAEFAPLNPEPSGVADGRVTFRLPKQIVDQLPDPKEAAPAFLRDIPGLAAAYRGRLPVGPTQYPVVLLVGAVPPAQRRRDDVKQAILEQVRGDESFRKAAWGKSRQIDDAAGQPRTWDVLTLEGEQSFELLDAGVAVDKRRPGLTEIWVSAEPKQKTCVVLAWRVPEELAATVPLDTLAPLTARTVTIAD